MDFLNLLSVARRHRLIMAFGVLLGVIAVIVSQYKFDPSAEGGSALRKRSFTRYVAEMQVLVMEPKFWMGRAGSDVQAPDMFDKTITLATTYANLMSSDAVKEEAQANAGIDDVEVLSESVAESPIIRVQLTGTDPEHIVAFGEELAKSLEKYLEKEQDARDIRDEERVSVRLLSTPVPQPEQSREWEISLLAFLAPVFLAYGLALLRDRARPQAPPAASA